MSEQGNDGNFHEKKSETKKEFSELDREFFKEAADKLEQVFQTQKPKISNVRTEFHNIMRGLGYEEVTHLTLGFNKILEIFKVKDDQELIDLLINKNKKDASEIENNFSEQEKNTQYIKEPVFTDKQRERLIKDSELQRLQELRRAGLKEDNEDGNNEN